MSKIEIVGDVRQYQGKGHDRYYKDEDLLVVGVFDGAGGDELSKEIVATLPKSIQYALGERALNEAAFLANILHRADSLESGLQRKATAAIASLSLNHSETAYTIAYANAGDSSIYYYDHEDDRLVRLAHTPTSYFKRDGRIRIATDDFLGNMRSLETTTELVSTISADAHSRWSLIGFSDGVQDDDGQGITKDDLQDILRVQPTHDVPEHIFSAYTHYDDASVFIVTNSTS